MTSLTTSTTKESICLNCTFFQVSLDTLDFELYSCEHDNNYFLEENEVPLIESCSCFDYLDE
jgi:hypothetical protein